MKKDVFLIGLIFLIIFLAGCTNLIPKKSGCNKNAIKVRDYNVLKVEGMYPGDITSIYFWLENRGSYDGENVGINFFDTQGFNVLNLRCGDSSTSENECRIDRIEAGEKCDGDIVEVNVELEAPGLSGDRTVSFSVKYDYRGTAEMLFNIWKRGIDQWGKKRFSQTTGPISLSIDPGFFLQRIVDGKTQKISEWVEEGQRFTLKMDVIDVGTNFEKTELTIPRNNFRIEFEGIYPDPDRMDKCSFEKQVYVYIPKEDVKVPTGESLKCDMIAGNVEKDWDSGRIKVSYSYTYEFIVKQDFKIVEPEEEEV